MGLLCLWRDLPKGTRGSVLVTEVKQTGRGKYAAHITSAIPLTGRGAQTETRQIPAERNK